MKQILLLNMLFLCFLFSCNNTAESAGETMPADSTRPVTSQTTGSEESAAATEKEMPGVAELLQGKWQHVDDKTNYLEFTGDRRREIAAGMDAWDEEPYVLAETCVNSSDKDNGATPEKDRYISCPQSDLCWYIIGVDKENLSLSYTGRGNTLTYKRVN